MQFIYWQVKLTFVVTFSILFFTFIVALYHESNLVEEWENSKVEADMEIYDWSRNQSKIAATEYLNYKATSDKVVEPPEEYGKSVEALLNEGENEYNLEKYKEQVVKMLGIAWQRPSPSLNLESVKPVKKPKPKAKKKKEKKEESKPEDTKDESKVEEAEKSEPPKRTFWFHP